MKHDKKTCVMCRQKIDIKSIKYIDEIESKNEEHESKENVKNTAEVLSKPDTIIKIIKTTLQTNDNRRFIIFSEYDETFKIIKRTLAEGKIEVSEIKGRVTNRMNYIKKYKSGDIKVIFLNSNYNGAGLNLENTTDIILYHNVSSDTKEQIIGRGNRINRTGHLIVHQLE
jgi:ERCC4-related helicase